MVETGPTSFNAIQLIVDLVRAIEGDINKGFLWEGVELNILQPGLNDDLAGLVTGWDELDVGGAVVFKGLYSFDHVDNCAAGADTNVFRGGIEVIRYGANGCVAFGGLDVGHFRRCYEGKGEVKGWDRYSSA